MMPLTAHTERAASPDGIGMDRTDRHRRAGGAGGLLLVIALIGPLLLPSQAAAQATRRLDDAQFIQGLRERGMKDLLLYYLERRPPDDPLLKQQIVIEQHKLRFEDRALPPEQRTGAADAVLDAYRELFDLAGDKHPQLPIWRTQFVEYIFRVALPARRLNAGLFVEFGVPTAEQRAAFDALIAEALRAMDQAAEQMFFLLGDLPRRDDFEQRFVNTGLWRRLRRDYGAIQLPYYRAWAHYYGTLMSEPAGQLGEALRLLREVADQDLSPEAEPELASLTGRVLLALNQPDRAIEQLDSAIQHARARPATVFVVRLARSEALHRLRRDADALSLLSQARQADFVTANPMMLVLSFDRQFRITGDHGVYERLLEHPAAQPHKDAIRTFITQRLASDSADETRLADAAPLVVLANADAMIRKGAQQLRRARQPDASQASGEHTAEARRHFNRADALLRNLLDRSGLPDKTRAEALFKLGALRYQAGEQYAAARAWADLAARMTDQPPAANAAVNAFIIAQALYREQPDNRQAADLFDRAQTVLLEKHPGVRLPNGSPARLHWHTRGVFLRERGRYKQALDAFDRVGPDHPLYADALYQKLVCHYELWRAAPVEQRLRRAQQVIDAAESARPVLHEAAEPPEPASGDDADTRLYQAGDILLRHAEVIAETFDDPARANELLDGFEQRYAAFDDLLLDKHQLTIRFLVRSGRISEARDQIVQVADRFPTQAGSMVRAVLEPLNRRVNDRKTIDGDWRSLAGIGVELARFLIGWAADQRGLGDDPEAMRPYRLILGEQLLIAEQYDEAAALFSEIAAQSGGDENLQVLYGRARALFRLGRHDQALPVINKILRLAPDKDDPVVWHGWVMRLDILDARYEAAHGAGREDEAARLSREIFTSIAKLELFNEQLGGQPYRQQLSRLANKHHPQ